MREEGAILESDAGRPRCFMMPKRMDIRQDDLVN